MEQKSIVDLINNIKLNEEIITFNWNDIKIEVKGYLKMEKKKELIEWVISRARRYKDTNILCQIDIDKLFDIAIINYYTNFKFDIINKNTFEDVYDILNTNNFFNVIISSIPPHEYEYIKTSLQVAIDEDNDYQKSFGGNINRILSKTNQDFKNIDKILNKLQNFDIEKYSNVTDLVNKIKK